jgi:hypothetical protein
MNGMKVGGRKEKDEDKEEEKAKGKKARISRAVRNRLHGDADVIRPYRASLLLLVRVSYIPIPPSSIPMHSSSTSTSYIPLFLTPSRSSVHPILRIKPQRPPPSRHPRLPGLAVSPMPTATLCPTSTSLSAPKNKYRQYP